MNPRLALRQVLQEEDARLRQITICPDCQRPTIGVQFGTGRRKVQTRSQAGLCVCRVTLAKIRAQGKPRPARTEPGQSLPEERKIARHVDHRKE